MNLSEKSWKQEFRHRDRGRTYFFAPMVDFNIMSEMGDTPP